MRKIFDIAWNDVKIEFSSTWTLVFFLILPLVFTAVIGASMSSMYDEDDPDADHRFPVLVVDEDSSDLSAELGAALEASDVIRPVFESREQAERLFEEEDALAILTIPADFGDALLDGQPTELSLRKSPNDNRVLAVEQTIHAAAGQVDSAVTAARASVAEAERIRPFESDAARQAYFAQGLVMARQVLDDPPVSVTVTRPPEVDERIASGFEQSSAGQLVTWTLTTLIGASYVFVDERLRGTLRRLLITPTGKATILCGKVLGHLGMGIVQMALLIVVGAAVFGVNWGQSPPALALMVLSFGLTGVAFGVLLSTFLKTQRQSSGLTTLFSMLMAALGGAWWPLEVTPQIYQTVVKALPSTWAMIGFNDIIVRGQGVNGVLPEVGVLLSFALVFFVVGVWRLRYE
ncbi:MAG: ABC transporter permease [Chloroflexi bacterium]|nr:ABC transporter permease [Chloroflexota bacterium]